MKLINVSKDHIKIYNKYKRILEWKRECDEYKGEEIEWEHFIIHRYHNSD